MSNYINFFGFEKQPFPQTVKTKNLYHFPFLKQMFNRFEYAVQIGMINIITGDVGSGKSTSLRYACSKFHPSKYKMIPVIANTGSMLELLRQIALAFNVEMRSNSITFLIKNIRQVVKEIFDKKTVPVLVIDEAHLMREKVFQQLHTILQFDFNSEKIMPLILCGQNSLISKLHFHTSEALRSRVVGKTKFEGLTSAQTSEYIKHHLKIAGITENLYDDNALLAIHQGSGGTMRKVNNLARGSLLAATSKKSRLITGEHVRLASTELF